MPLVLTRRPAETLYFRQGSKQNTLEVTAIRSDYVRLLIDGRPRQLNIGDGLQMMAGQVWIHLSRIHGQQVSLAMTAPTNINIVRGELVEAQQ